MGRTKQATSASIREEAAAALARYREGRRNPPFRMPTEKERLESVLNGTGLPRSGGLFDDEYRQADTIPEFFDVLIIVNARVGWDPHPLLAAVAVAARESAARAVAAVGPAVGLTSDQQRAVRDTVASWQAQPDARRTGADRVCAAVLAELARLELPADEYAALEARRHVYR